MPSLREFLSPRQKLVQQAREIEALKRELAVLQTQNDSMRQGMRRCVTCEYRIDFKNRQGHAEPQPALPDQS